MDRITFTVNDVECSVGAEVASTTTILQYLRETLHLSGTKYMCLQGGCGACIVSVAKYPGGPVMSVNSCLVSIASCQNWEISTIENLGNRLKGYHPLQKTLAECNGSQCGHCSPGWVMAMYSLMKQKDLTMLEIEKSFGSNVCRCTGYRPILEALKKFAKDSPTPICIPDIEDLRICEKTGDTCKGMECNDREWCVISKDEGLVESVYYIKLKDNRKWYIVQSIQEIFDVLRINGDESYMLVAGNTAKGIYPIEEYPRVLIDIGNVSALKRYKQDQNLVIGAGNTLTELMQIFNEAGKIQYFNYLNTLNDHLDKVAHIPVRNMGSIAGNLMMKHQHPDFRSDIFLLLQTVDAQIIIVYRSGFKKSVTMMDFLKENIKSKIILSILLPPLCENCKIVTYKISPRAQNALAIVNAGFFYKLTKEGTVQTCRIIYGGLSSRFNRALKTERHLCGKNLFTNETLQSAINILKNEIIVLDDPVNFTVEYRRRLAIGLFYKSLLSISSKTNVHPRYISGSIKLRDTRPVSKGSQSYDTDTTLWPLNEPINKVDALIQCAGEAKYTDDLPPLPNQTFAAFVLSTVPLGDIENIDATKALKYPGVIAFYSAEDIEGLNSFTPDDSAASTKNEEVFCNGQVKCYNQVIGVIVADNQHAANVASKLVTMQYNNVKKPIIDVKIAKNIPARNTLFTSIQAKEKGNQTAKIIKGSVSIYGQYHFPMETVACVSHPSEQGMQIYPTTQFLDAIQLMTSRMLNMDQNSFDIHLQRLGGSFGLKVSRPTQVALACNLIVHKLGRPCRFIQTLENNMRVFGKRFPNSSDFEVGIDTTGKIQYLEYKIYEDRGYIGSEPILLLATPVYSNCYDKKRWTYVSYETITDTSANTFFRSPATLEHISTCEFIMEQIACEMRKDPIEIRLTNLDTQNSKDLEDMYLTLRKQTNYDQRKAAVNNFNESNRWLKRGLRFVFMTWPSDIPLYLYVTLSVYHGDGSVALCHSGVDMGQGINTRAIQVCASLLKISVDKIKVKSIDTISSPNSYPTGNSVTSQCVGIGVTRCCKELLKSLEPIRSEMDNPQWPALIKQAYNSGVNLKTQAITNANDNQTYNVYGVALAEVEIDVITGEWECLQVDLCEDVGRSINPSLDVGQIEGAFVMGLGYWTTERLVLDQNTGELLTNDASKYFVPQARDIPHNLNVYFRKDSYSNDAILGSKVTGEPATCMAVVVPIAMREAITSARSESNIPADEWFQIDGPYTVEKICLASKTRFEDFKFY